MTRLATPTFGSSWLGPTVLKNLHRGGAGHRNRNSHRSPQTPGGRAQWLPSLGAQSPRGRELSVLPEENCVSLRRCRDCRGCKIIPPLYVPRRERSTVGVRRAQGQGEGGTRQTRHAGKNIKKKKKRRSRGAMWSGEQMGRERRECKQQAAYGGKRQRAG